jgi:Ni2+-binding GTPase involved in maturation of urease and hydrogenase
MMRFLTVSGPPSSGKTSVILKALEVLKPKTLKICVMKFDCLATNDDRLYAAHGIDSKVGLSGSLCPDHYFVSNIWNLGGLLLMLDRAKENRQRSSA